MQGYERKKEEFTHRGVKSQIAYFVTPSGRVERFDIYAVLDEAEGEVRLGASILGWETVELALAAARSISVEKIEKHLSAQ